MRSHFLFMCSLSSFRFDQILTRWKRNSNNMQTERNGKPVLEVLVCKRKKGGEWALPGCVKVLYTLFVCCLLRIRIARSADSTLHSKHAYIHTRASISHLV